jgi:DNA repair exonuclease SbcCD ATPase subunit
MKLTRLEITNFKRIRVVEITPTGNVVVIRGRNGSGKSSALDGIAALLGGEKLCPQEPIRRGENEAVLRGRLDQFPEFGTVIVERKFTRREDGEVTSSLKLSREDGLPLNRPQKRLDELLGRLSFDPLAFLRISPREQAETLRGITGVDFSLLDAKRAKAYEARRAANAQVVQLEARLRAAPEVDAPDEQVSIAALLEESQALQKQKAANDLERAALQRSKDVFAARKRDAEAAAAEVERARQALAAAEERQRAADEALEASREAGKAQLAKVEQLVDPDLSALAAQMRDVEAVNEKVRAKAAFDATRVELEAAKALAKRLDDEISAVDQQKAEALASAKLPVPGLAFSDAGVTFEGLPLDQASQSQQLRISVAMGAALNPQLRATLVRDGSLLDEDSLSLLHQEAQRADLQVWLEVVGKNGEGIVIEDGAVEGASAPVEVRP